MVRFEEDANGGEATFQMDETFEICLAENRTTGFQWVTESKGEPVCELVSESAEAPSEPSGKGGTHHWHFRVVKAGRGTILLRYLRPWETEGHSEQTFQMHVHVKK
jgi:predicted secreted protein